MRFLSWIDLAERQAPSYESDPELSLISLVDHVTANQFVIANNPSCSRGGTRFAAARLTSMPNYFFNIRKDQETLLDDAGISFASSEHAVKEARLAIKQMAAEAVLRDKAVDETGIHVLDEDGNLIACALLATMLTITIWLNLTDWPNLPDPEGDISSRVPRHSSATP